MNSWTFRGAIVVVVLLAGVALLVETRTVKEDSPRLLSGATVERALQAQPEGGLNRAKKAQVPLERLRESGQQHIHVAVRVVVQGALYYPPRDLGFVVGGLLSLHTHDRSGVVHLHRPRGTPQFTFSDIIAAWGVTVSNRQIGVWKLGKPPMRYRAVVLYNGKQLSPGEALPLTLKDRDDVVIEVTSSGLPFTSRVSAPPFEWSEAALRDVASDQLQD